MDNQIFTNQYTLERIILLFDSQILSNWIWDDSVPREKMIPEKIFQSPTLNEIGNCANLSPGII